VVQKREGALAGGTIFPRAIGGGGGSPSFLHHCARARKQKTLKILCFVICVEDYHLEIYRLNYGSEYLGLGKVVPAKGILEKELWVDKK
jgi:hypothetical protein